jgi:hypothetical protein
MRPGPTHHRCQGRRRSVLQPGAGRGGRGRRAGRQCPAGTASSRIRCRRSLAEEAVTPGFAVGRFLPAIQGNRSGRARRKGQCGRHRSIGVISHDGLIPDPNEDSVVVGPWTMCATVTPSPALRSGCWAESVWVVRSFPLPLLRRRHGGRRGRAADLTIVLLSGIRSKSPAAVRGHLPTHDAHRIRSLQAATRPSKSYAATAASCLALTTGSIACALILGIVPNLVLIPPLPCFLLITGIKLWRHLAEGSEADHLRRSGATLGWQTHSHPDHDRSRWVSRLVRRSDSRPACGHLATSKCGHLKLTISPHSARRI